MSLSPSNKEKKLHVQQTFTREKTPLLKLQLCSNKHANTPS